MRNIKWFYAVVIIVALVLAGVIVKLIPNLF